MTFQEWWESYDEMVAKNEQDCQDYSVISLKAAWDAALEAAAKVCDGAANPQWCAEEIRKMKNAPFPVDDQAEFEVYVGDDFEASTSGPRDRALAEARHYALQYAEDGDVRIEEITRRLVETLHSSGTSTEREKA